MAFSVATVDRRHRATFSLCVGMPPAGPNRRSCAALTVWIASKLEDHGGHREGVSYGRRDTLVLSHEGERVGGHRRIVLAVSASVLGMLVFAAPASATTVTFNDTGAAQTWTVPAGVTERDLRPLRGAGCRRVDPWDSPRDSAAKPRRRFPSPPAPRSRSTSAVRGRSVAPGASTAAAPPPAAATAAAAPQTFASAARRSQTVCSSRAVAGDRGPRHVPTPPPPPGAPVVGVRSARRPTRDVAPPRSRRRRRRTARGETRHGARDGGRFGVGGDGGGSDQGGGGGGGGWFGGGGAYDDGGGGGGSGHGPPGTVFQTGVRSRRRPRHRHLHVDRHPDRDRSRNSTLPSGTTRTLLGEAQHARQKPSPGQRTAACNQLAAFITQVKTQSGKKIPGPAAAS